jgi:hypothetical protein
LVDVGIARHEFAKIAEGLDHFVYAKFKRRQNSSQVEAVEDIG